MSFTINPRQTTTAEMLAQGLGGAASQGIQQAMTEFEEKRQLQKSEQEYLKQGFPADLAKLASIASKGGETAVLKEVLEERKRGMQPQQKQINEPTIKDVVSDFDSGLTPSEKIRRQSERYKTGLPVYQETSTKLRGLEREKERLHILDNLNKSGKLPKNIGRLNIDKNGNLRLPYLASSEAQRYIKTLNEFSSGAKDTYGSRVTNFDLQQFMSRYPTLLNSQEGREQIYQQMRIVNKINSVFYRNLKKVFDDAGGVRKIDADIAESLAEKMSEKEIDKLVEQFDKISSKIAEGNEVEELPTAINRSTGERLILKEDQWQPLQ
jgi:hypothetical protein